MAEGRNDTENLRSLQDMEGVINEGLRIALLEGVPDRALDVFLKHLGKALDGERTYILSATPPEGMTTPTSGWPGA